MELKPAELSAWTLASPPQKLMPTKGGIGNIALVFGPDEGGVLALGRALLASSDEVRIFDGGALGTQAEEIASAIGSGSLFAASPSVLIQGAEDRQYPILEELVEMARANQSRLVITAGNLRPNSRLRKLFASIGELVSAPIYRMRDREIGNFARQTLRDLGVKADGAAIAALSQRLPGDRAAATRDCEVLALYALGGASRGTPEITDSDISVALDAVDEDALHAPIDHALEGDIPAAIRALQIRIDMGENMIGLLRAFGRRLFQIRALIEGGLSPRQAVKSARPPIFWAEQDAMIRRITGITPAMVDDFLCRIDSAEHSIVELAANQRHTVSRLLEGISRATGKARR